MYFGAVQGQPRKASTDVLRAPVSPGPREVSAAVKDAAERPACAANAEAAIYSPVLDARVRKTRRLHQKAVLEEPKSSKKQLASPCPREAVAPRDVTGAPRAAEGSAPSQDNPTVKHTEGREGGPIIPPTFSETTTLLLVCGPP